MSFATARARITAGSLGDVEQVTSVADTKANALNELSKKLALMVGHVESVSVSEGQDATLYPSHGASGENYPATFVLFKSGLPTRNIRVNQVSVAYALAGSLDGSIDVTNPDISAFAGAIVDSDGQTGFAILSGKFDI